VYKAVANGDMRKARSLQKLILKSQSARFIAIRQVTQLNAGKRTAGVDGKKSLNHKERFELNENIKDGETSKAIKKQNHLCHSCNHKFLPGQRIHLHHLDGNHSNWKKANLAAVHEACHDYIHMR
jgi:hypothetical protein